MSVWKFRERLGSGAPPQWAAALSITPLLLEILWRRGLRTLTGIDNYLSARLKTLSLPDAWPNIPEAADLLATGLLAGKKLAVWGDYDVDGITATTMVLDILEAHGFYALHHLPDRRREGYGLNVVGVEQLAAEGCSLLLTVDCGISDIEAIKRGRELGMTVIVSDHHLPPDFLPPANVIVNPRMSVDSPCACLAGVGVAFYLMGAVNARLAPHTGKRYQMDRALDLVGLGTLADVMQLEGENRVLVRGGLKRLGDACRPGIAALKAVSGFDLSAQLNSGQAVFRLAPRLNAAGRMGDPDLALKLLRCRDYAEAEVLAKALDERNQQRKAEERRIFGEASQQATELLANKNYAGLVIYGQDWHPGIIGIVASRIVEKFNRPAIVLCKDGASLKGSGRSVPNFDLHAGLCKTAAHLSGFGGHSQAAGVRLKEAKLEDFRESFNNAALECLGETPQEPMLLLEGELDFKQASNHKFLKELQLMQPFGPGNAEPIFASPILLVKRRSLLGHSQEHVMLEVQDQKSKLTLYAKAWRMAEDLPSSLVGRHIRLAYIPRLDIYNGLPRIDLEVRDWRLSRETPI